MQAQKNVWKVVAGELAAAGAHADLSKRCLQHLGPGARQMYTFRDSSRRNQDTDDEITSATITDLMKTCLQRVRMTPELKLAGILQHFLF